MRLLVVAPLLLVSLAGCMGGGDTGYTSLDSDAWAARLAETEEPFVLDVRTQAEYDEAHIANATLIPHDEVRERRDELPADEGHALFVYCRTGNRSAQASEVLVDMGYTNVIHLDEGIEDWVASGHPVVRPGS